MIQVFMEETFDCPLVHNFDIVEDKDGGASLIYSADGAWSESLAGTVAMSLIDNGDGLQVELDTHLLSLDYSQAQQLLILLLRVFGDKMEFREYSVVKRIE